MPSTTTDWHSQSNWSPMMSQTPNSNDVFFNEKMADINTLEQSEKFVIATLAALETGNLTPLVKEELKYSINARRMAEGKETIQADFKEPEVAVLTPDEEEKVEKRRNQNKIAARRFREKQKRLGDHLTKKSKILESNNVRLMNEIRQLRRESLALQKQLVEHLKHCKYSFINNT